MLNCGENAKNEILVMAALISILLEMPSVINWILNWDLLGYQNLQRKKLYQSDLGSLPYQGLKPGLAGMYLSCNRRARLVC